MAIDDSKLKYSSDWDIDQLVATGEVTVGSGTTPLYVIPPTSPPLPVFEVQFKDSGKWYQPGAYSTNGTLAGVNSFYTYVSAGVVYIVTTKSGTARYFVWEDKLDY